MQHAKIFPSGSAMSGKRSLGSLQNLRPTGIQTLLSESKSEVRSSHSHNRQPYQGRMQPQAPSVSSMVRDEGGTGTSTTAPRGAQWGQHLEGTKAPPATLGLSMRLTGMLWTLESDPSTRKGQAHSHKLHT